MNKVTNRINELKTEIKNVGNSSRLSEFKSQDHLIRNNYNTHQVKSVNNSKINYIENESCINESIDLKNNNKFIKSAIEDLNMKFNDLEIK